MASLNTRVLKAFGPVLIATGVLAFILPADPRLMSGAPAYNLFHIAFGLLGTWLARKGETASLRFNLAFGVIDLYQIAAHRLDLFPNAHFRYNPADDLAHLVIGAGLVAVALAGANRAARR